MWTRLVALMVVAAPAAAQEGPAPLSAIDWLSANPPTQAAPVTAPAAEDPVADSAATPNVTVQPLDGDAPRRIGLVPSTVTGLPGTLWAATDGAAVAQRMQQLRVPRLPAAQALLYTLLLAETDPPVTAPDRLTLARIDTLLRLGAVAPALELARQAGPQNDPDLFARFMDAALLAEAENEACAILRGPAPPSTSYAPQIFCAARSGDWQTAALLIGTANAVGELTDAQADLLARFLDPDLFEGEPPLPAPDPIDPLSARLLDAIGQPGATSAWPRVYAHLDLRDVAGWKAQLDAAERLAETGAIDANQLLGVFTARRAAASGGIWDRVRALQNLQTAVATGSSEAIGKTVGAALEASIRGRMAVPVASIFGQDVLDAAPAGGQAAMTLALLSPHYEAAAARYPKVEAPLARAVARGDTAQIAANGPMETAVRNGFSDAAPDTNILNTAQNGGLGLAIIETLALLDQGTRGDATALSRALATLRALGLEDIARRAGLQILLLDRTG
ncbi:MAG: hypothetical protein AAF218_08255 [Pseudomonadota bacterium]